MLYIGFPHTGGYTELLTLHCYRRARSVSSCHYTKNKSTGFGLNYNTDRNVFSLCIYFSLFGLWLGSSRDLEMEEFSSAGPASSRKEMKSPFYRRLEVSWWRDLHGRPLEDRPDGGSAVQTVVQVALQVVWFYYTLTSSLPFFLTLHPSSLIILAFILQL